jgi:hypothetical protein
MITAPTNPTMAYAQGEANSNASNATVMKSNVYMTSPNPMTGLYIPRRCRRLSGFWRPEHRKNFGGTLAERNAVRCRNLHESAIWLP